MPLAAAVASAVAPPPPRRPGQLRSVHLPRAGALPLTAPRCSTSPSPQGEEARPKPRQYPRQYPGEAVGVAEEMRFVAMRLRIPKRTTIKDKPGEETEAEDAGAGGDGETSDEDDGVNKDHEEEEGDVEAGEWMPSMEGFVKYLVDSKLVFDTIERIVAESTDVACE
jgi:heme oxygenase (biliverdin-producing, ferredoxin)